MDTIKKVNLYCAVVILLLIGAGVFLFWSTRIIKEADRKHALAHEIIGTSLKLNSLTMSYFLQVKNQELFEQWNTEYTNLSRLLDTDLFFSNENSRQVFIKIRQDTLTLKTRFDDILFLGNSTNGTLLVKNGTNSFDTLFVNEKQFNQLANLYLEISVNAVSLADIGKEELTRSVRLVTYSGSVVFLIILIIGLFGAHELIKYVPNKNIGMYIEDIKRRTQR